MAKKKSLSKKDPFATREAQRYENPIPSREFILELLVNEGMSLKRSKIAKRFGLSGEEQNEALRRRLIAMVRDCQIAKVDQGYAALTLFHQQSGRLKIEKDGFGLVQGGEYAVKISPRDIRGYYDGDILKVRTLRYDKAGQAFGQVEELVEAQQVFIVGRFFKEADQSYVMPLGRHYIQDIRIPKNKTKKAIEGDIVQVELNRSEDTRAPCAGSVVHVLGQPEREGIEIDVAIAKFQIPSSWPRGTVKEASDWGKSIPKPEIARREDLRELPLVTIDGEDAKDFDDAVYAKATSTGWRLVVAIADVSHYVKPNSKLDNEAINRGNSVYFPGYVIPMLPAQLSNGLCSLNPNQDRLALVCDMRISKKGVVTRYQFYPATIRSHARLTYSVVAKILDGDKRAAKKFKEVVGELECLESLYQVLAKGREQRGAMEFDSVETMILFDDMGKIACIEPRERNIAHRIIEECMLAANVSAAKFLKKNRMPTLYRVHPTPSDEKLNALRDFLSELGLHLNGKDEPTPKDYAKLLSDIQGRDDAHIIQTVILRSLSQAEYSMEQDGHFGLAYDHYTHFTSPIRRYPDLIVHRQIKALVSDKEIDKPKWRNELESLGPHCSMTERRADDATRDATMALKCHYMVDKVGERFMGKVTAVTSFGLFVELDSYYIEGLVHVASLGDDYFYYEPFKHRMIGERTRKIYQLGDSLEVQLMRVDTEDKKIDLEIVTQDGLKQTKGTGRKSAKSGRGSKSAKAAKTAKGSKNKGPKGKRRKKR